MSEDNGFYMSYENGEYLINFGRSVIDRFDLLVMARQRLAIAEKIIDVNGDFESPVESYNRIFKSREKMEVIAEIKRKNEIRNKRINRKSKSMFYPH